MAKAKAKVIKNLKDLANLGKDGSEVPAVQQAAAESIATEVVSSSGASVSSVKLVASDPGPSEGPFPTVEEEAQAMASIETITAAVKEVFPVEEQRATNSLIPSTMVDAMSDGMLDEATRRVESRIRFQKSVTDIINNHTRMVAAITEFCSEAVVRIPSSDDPDGWLTINKTTAFGLTADQLVKALIYAKVKYTQMRKETQRLTDANLDLVKSNDGLKAKIKELEEAHEVEIDKAVEDIKAKLVAAETLANQKFDYWTMPSEDLPYIIRREDKNKYVACSAPSFNPEDKPSIRTFAAVENIRKCAKFPSAKDAEKTLERLLRYYERGSERLSISKMDRYVVCKLQLVSKRKSE